MGPVRALVQCARRVVPAGCAETIADWAVSLADGTDGVKPRAKKTIQLYCSAILYAHRAKGYEPKSPIIDRALKGISRVKARTEIPRKAAPPMDKQLLKMLQDFDPSRPADARDAALLAIGWAGALRRSEAVALDWMELGEGGGVIRIEERGVEIVLMTSKASQKHAVSIAIPAANMPAALRWLERWAEIAALQPGSPVFKQVDRFGRILPGRLSDWAVGEIVKKRVGAHAIESGKTPEEAAVSVGRVFGTVERLN